MPIYEYGCEECKYEWEDLYKVDDPAPTECPKCKGKVKKLISWCTGKAELTGRDHLAKLRQEGRELARKARTDENLLANIVGEDKYHKNQLKK